MILNFQFKQSSRTIWYLISKTPFSSLSKYKFNNYKLGKLNINIINKYNKNNRIDFKKIHTDIKKDRNLYKKKNKYFDKMDISINNNIVNNKVLWSEFNLELIGCVKIKNFEKSLILYENMKNSGLSIKSGVFTTLLSICHQKNHLNHAIKLFNDMLTARHVPTEPAYLSLIRCFSSANKIEECLALIKHMRLLSIEPKLRTYHPILEAIALAEKNPTRVLKLLQHMTCNNVIPRSEQLLVLFRCGIENNSFADDKFCQDVDDIIKIMSTELLGLHSEDINKIVMLFNNLTVEQLKDQGILVESVNSIKGKLIVGDIDKDGSLFAINENFENAQSVVSETLCSPASSDPTIPIVKNISTAFASREPDKYVILNNANSINKNNSLSNIKSRIIDISNDTSRCPNCNSTIASIYLTEGERHRVRVSMNKITATSNLIQCKNLQDYYTWLQEKEEFVYIVDGANVAYNGQNFDTGKFSYRQIELVVDKLKERGERILVLIPYPYAQKIVPNSAKQRGGRRTTLLTKEDQRILEKLEDEGMLYVVPPGANDDWYWIFATVCENRKKIAYVVTNDLMRDHRLAFLEPLPFLRWRSTQIIHFDFNRTVETELYDPEVILIEPGNFSREIQQSKNLHWHIPATNKRSWLCLNINNL
jgi:pentatricopeptide repeat protein